MISPYENSLKTFYRLILANNTRIKTFRVKNRFLFLTGLVQQMAAFKVLISRLSTKECHTDHVSALKTSFANSPRSYNPTTLHQPCSSPKTLPVSNQNPNKNSFLSTFSFASLSPPINPSFMITFHIMFRPLWSLHSSCISEKWKKNIFILCRFRSFLRLCPRFNNSIHWFLTWLMKRRRFCIVVASSREFNTQNRTFSACPVNSFHQITQKQREIGFCLWAEPNVVCDCSSSCNELKWS
jgi:hypothetical protein